MVRINYKEKELIGKLIFLKDVENTTPRKALFMCPICSNQFTTDISRAKLNRVVSCGCYRKENSKKLHFKHGHSKDKKMSSEYVSWQRMIQRCQNLGYANYHNYGGKGITVCNKWKNSFVSFLEDMKEKPFKNAQLDRINTDGNYEPNNCRWVSCKENSRNRRDNLVIEWNDQKKTLSEWSEILNINKNTLRDRIYSTKWTLEEAMSTPLLKKGEKRNY
jgi:hypothetical protein